MKTFSSDTGGSNTMFCWSYINRYLTGERVIWVAGMNEFTTDRAAERNEQHRIATANRTAAINGAANAIRKHLLTNDEALILIQAITAGLNRIQPVMDTVTQEVIERLDEVALYLDDEVGV